MCSELESLPGAARTSEWLFWPVQREALHPGQSWTWRIQHPCTIPKPTTQSKQDISAFSDLLRTHSSCFKQIRKLFYILVVLTLLKPMQIQLSIHLANRGRDVACFRLNHWQSQHVANVKRLRLSEKEQFVSCVWNLFLSHWKCEPSNKAEHKCN